MSRKQPRVGLGSPEEGRAYGVGAMPEFGLTGLTRNDDLLSPEKSNAERVLENPFLNSAAHTLLQTPLEAAAQVIDQASGSKILPSVQFLPEMQKAEFGTSGWFQQQIGGAVGALPYIIALHQGSRAALSGKMLSADTKLMLASGVKLGSTGARELTRLELASAGITGFTYGGLLTPARPDEFNTNAGLLGAKFKNGLVGAGTFMTLTGSMMGTKNLAGHMKPGFARTVLASDMGAGAVSGLPAGFVHAQADSILAGRGPASLQETAEAMTGFVAIGALMPAGQRGAKSIVEYFKADGKASNVAAIESVKPNESRQLKEPGAAPEVKPVERVFNQEQLKTINEWKEAQAKLAETKLRESDPALIQKLADEAYGSGAPVKGRKLHILLGNCGAGKSRVTDALARELGAMTPDSDMIKARIPGYEKGMGNQAVHEDSSAAYKILLDRALANGDNIVWQGVGKTAKSVTDLMAQAKEHGYEVVVHMIDAPPEVAAMRVYNRANQPPEAETGVRQMIPPEVPLNPKYQYVPRLNFFKMVGEAASTVHEGGPKLIDGFRLWRSTGEKYNSYLPSPGTLPALKPSWMKQEESEKAAQKK